MSERQEEAKQVVRALWPLRHGALGRLMLLKSIDTLRALQKWEL